MNDTYLIPSSRLLLGRPRGEGKSSSLARILLKTLSLFWIQYWKSLTLTFLNLILFPCFCTAVQGGHSFIEKVPKCLKRYFVMCVSRSWLMVLWKITWKYTSEIKTKIMSVMCVTRYFIRRMDSHLILECTRKTKNSVKCVQSLSDGRFPRVTCWNIVAKSQ